MKASGKMEVRLGSPMACGGALVNAVTATIGGMTDDKRKHFKSGGYSREFTPHGKTGKRYLLDEIPAGFWADVKVKAKRDGISIRALILGLLREWLKS